MHRWLLAVLLWIPLIACAQWDFVTSGDDILMTAPSVGFWAENVFLSPSSGGYYRIHYTTDGWLDDTVVYEESGQGSMVARAHGMERTSDSSMFYVHDFGPGSLRSLTMHNGVASVWGTTTSGHVIYPPIAPVNDTLCYFSALATSDTIGFFSYHPSDPADSGPQSFFPALPEGKMGLDFLDQDRGMLVFTDVDGTGWILRTTDGGASWVTVMQDPILHFRGVAFVDSATIWTVGDHGTMFKSMDAGLTLSSVVVPTQEDVLCVSSSSSGHVWIAGSNGLVMRTADGGATWSDLSIGNAQSVLRIQPLGTVVFAYVENGAGRMLYHYAGPDAGLPELRVTTGLHCVVDATGIQVVLPADAQIRKISLLDALGRIIRVERSGDRLWMFDLAAGPYVVLVHTSKGDYSAKVFWPSSE